RAERRNPWTRCSPTCSMCSTSSSAHGTSDRHSRKAMFSYNSSHKVIIGIIIVLWAAFHFTARDEDPGRYPNGQAKYSGSLVDNQNHGRWTWYYENGKRRMEGQFDRGKRQGLWTTWASDGTKRSEGLY